MACLYKTPSILWHSIIISILSMRRMPGARARVRGIITPHQERVTAVPVHTMRTPSLIP